MDIHAICPALNEEIFIRKQLETLYPLCSGISILSQYDRDWFGNSVKPDSTIQKVLNHPDPKGKIQLIVRRWRDQAAALNSEMNALSSAPHDSVDPHGSSLEEIRDLHKIPDYFLIVDADEFYDPESFGDIVSYLDAKRPRAMRVHGYNYKRSWNRRAVNFEFCQFGFVKPGLAFEHARELTWNESRLSKLLRLLRLPDVSERLFGFRTCPKEVGVFHHGCWLGDAERVRRKYKRSPHVWAQDDQFIEDIQDVEIEYVPTMELPRNIRNGDWPDGYLEEIDSVSSQ
jgi:hypothetical protein